MALSTSTMRFLSGLARFLPSWVRKKASVPLEEDEQVTRFIFGADRLFKDGRARPKAFFPDLHPDTGVRELSVCRLRGTAEARVWHLGRTCRNDVVLHATADFVTRAATEQKLTGLQAPEPNYGEHAVFIGWPDEPNGDKPLRLAIAQGLAVASTVRKPPAA